ncbi:MAG: TonB-dependent receptor, partial [Acidobacteriota bacterium]
HDDVGLAPRWVVSLGLRYDNWSGSLPAQSSPAGTYAPARQYDARDGVIGWWALSPRAAVSFDVLGDGKLLIMASFAQYAHQLGASTVSYGNFNAPGATTVTWVDDNGDGQFQPGEGGPVTTVTAGTSRSIDASLSTPLTREVRAGIDMALGSDWRARADFWYRKDDQLFDDVEVGLQAADFAEEVVLDPGPDNIVGSADDAGLRVFNQIDGFGDSARLLTTVDGKTGTYRGVDLSLQRPWADNWTLRAVLTLAYADGASDKSGLVPGDTGGISDLYDDPNTLINAGINGSAHLFWDRPWVLKVYGSYELPHGIVLAGVLRSWAGAPIGRILPVALNQGIVNVWAEPRGAAREDALTTGDVRVAKDLAIARNLRLSLYGDLFNITNAGTVVRTYQVFPIYGVPAEIVAPFIARVGARMTF